MTIVLFHNALGAYSSGESGLAKYLFELKSFEIETMWQVFANRLTSVNGSITHTERRSTLACTVIHQLRLTLEIPPQQLSYAKL